MKKSVILVTVMGVLIVLSVLAFVALYLMTQESRIAEHKIKRMRAIYAARAGLVHAYEKLRKNNTYTGETIWIGNGIAGYPSGGMQVKISVLNKGAGNCPNNAPSDKCIFVTANP